MLLEEVVVVVMYWCFCCILGKEFGSLRSHGENADVFCSVHIS